MTEQNDLVARIAALEAELEAIRGTKADDDECAHPDWLSDLVNISHDIEDEGDRCYFGSTNDADTLREVVESLTEASYSLNFFRRPDLHRHNAELMAENRALREGASDE